MTTETDLPPLPRARKMYDIPGYDEEELKDYARAAVANAVAPLQAEVEALRAEVERLNRYYKNGIDCFANPCERHSGERTPPFAEFFEKYGGQCLICVVDNNKALQAENERLRAEVERLQEIVRPKREDECLTLEHWRMLAYALEANWSRCSHACAVEQDKREQAEARAERLAEALRELEEREQRDEAMLRQALEVLSRAHQTAMVQTLKARFPECAEFGGIAQDLDFVVTALRERLGEGEQR